MADKLTDRQLIKQVWGEVKTLKRRVQTLEREKG